MSDVANYNIENASGANVRIDLNAVFGAIQSNNSKGSDLADSQCVTGMWFLRSDTNTLKIRNSSDQFTTVGNINSANLGLLPRSGGTTAPMTGQFLADDSNSATAPAISFATDENLGLFRKAADQMGFGCADEEQIVFDANGITLNLANAIRFSDNDSSNYVALKSPATLSNNLTLTLPGSIADGQFLKTDASGNLSFSAVSASTLTSNTLASGVTASSLTSVGTLTALTVSGDSKLTTIKDTSGNNASTPAELAQGRAKAWVHFNGTHGTSPFTVANGGIKDSFNVTSVTDNSAGKYTANMSITMTNNLYCVVGGGSQGSQNDNVMGFFPSTTTSFKLQSSGSTSSFSNFEDASFMSAAVFGDLA